ncbi:MAG: serine protease, partial [Patescibacteria group bacterium]
MSRFFRFSLFLLLFVPFVASASTVREKLLFSVVQIVTVGESGDVFLGSGSTIRSDGLILTNRHVVIDSETGDFFDRITLCYSTSQHLPPRCSATGKVLAVNEDLDLAIVIPDKRIAKDGSVTDMSFQKYWKKLGQKFYTVPFKNSHLLALPNILDRVTVWGYPVLGGSTVTVTSGYVSGFSVSDLPNEDSFVQFIKTDTEISAGNSGGAAFNDSFSFIGVPTRAHPG